MGYNIDQVGAAAILIYSTTQKIVNVMQKINYEEPLKVSVREDGRRIIKELVTSKQQISLEAESSKAGVGKS